MRLPSVSLLEAVGQAPFGWFFANAQKNFDLLRF
jgi:hypothetical protein